MDSGTLLITQEDRDRLVALQNAKKGLITQKEAAAEIGQSERHVRRLLKRMKGKGDAVIVHGLRGRQSNRRIDEKVKQAAIKILSDKVYAGFGPTLASEYLGVHHFSIRCLLGRHSFPSPIHARTVSGLTSISVISGGRVGAVGHERTRLAGGTRPQVVSDQHDSTTPPAAFTRGSYCTIPPRRTCARYGGTWSFTDAHSATTPTRRACFKPRRR